MCDYTQVSNALVEEGHDPNTFTLDDNEAANDSQLSETGNVEGDTSVTEEEATPEMDGQVKKLQETDEAADSSLVELGDPEEPEQVEEPVDSEKPVENPAADAESGVVSQEDERVAETGEAVEHELVTNDEEAAEQTSILEDADSFEPISDSAAAEALNEAADNNLVKSTVADDEVETVIDTDTNREDPSKESEAENELLNTAMDSEVDQFVVHVDESDTNLDYDLGDKAEERDAPTPTKDESMDVDASDIVQSEEHSASVTVTATSQAEKSEATSSTPTSATKSLSDVRVDVPKRDSKDLAASQNLWISNLSSLTRATDLKAVFSKHGKVIGAKVVTNANRPGAKCYGYVTMSSPEEAAKCIQNLHRTELHGRMISVEKAKSDPAAQARAATIRKPVGADDKKKEDSVAASAPKDETTSVDHKDDAGATDEVNGPTSTDDKTRVSDRLRPVRPPITGPGRKEGESEVRDGSQKPVDKPRKSTPERKVCMLLIYVYSGILQLFSLGQVEEALDREK
ncbi:SAFB [Bugula neritina]|uniref:SAFB n=1 Tax=Bugula neritina TaxID=10212 RepID=A0A7J7KQI0_BUGNE|nr:SAFB [Bugula neritina]